MAVSDHADDKINLSMTRGALLFGVPSLGMESQKLIELLQEGNLPAMYTAGLLDERFGFTLRMRQADDFHSICSKNNAIMYAFYETEETPTVCRVCTSDVLYHAILSTYRMRRHSVGFEKGRQRCWSVRVQLLTVLSRPETRSHGQVITIQC